MYKRQDRRSSRPNVQLSSEPTYTAKLDTWPYTGLLKWLGILCFYSSLRTVVYVKIINFIFNINVILTFFTKKMYVFPFPGLGLCHYCHRFLGLPRLWALKECSLNFTVCIQSTWCLCFHNHYFYHLWQYFLFHFCLLYTSRCV